MRTAGRRCRPAWRSCPEQGEAREEKDLVSCLVQRLISFFFLRRNLTGYACLSLQRFVWPCRRFVFPFSFLPLCFSLADCFAGSLEKGIYPGKPPLASLLLTFPCLVSSCLFCPSPSCLLFLSCFLYFSERHTLIGTNAFLFVTSRFPILRWKLPRCFVQN